MSQGRGRGLGRGRVVRKSQAGGGSTYVGEWRDAERKRRRRVLSTDRRVAERMLAAIIRERDLQLAGLVEATCEDLLLEELRGRYLDDLAIRCSASHVDTYSRALAAILPNVGAATVRTLRPAHVLKYLRQRKAQGVANATVNKELAALKAMLNWAVNAGLALSNPISSVSKLPEGEAYRSRSRRALSDQEVNLLLEAAAARDRALDARVLARRTIEGGTKGQGYAGRTRDRRVPQLPLWLALLDTGARWSELTSTTWGDLDETRGALILRAATTKSRRSRTIPITDQLRVQLRGVRALHAQIRGRLPRASDRIFLTPTGSAHPGSTQNARRELHALLAAAGIERIDDQGYRIDIHALRHTFASRLARVGVPLQQAQHLLGHSDPKLTAAIYTHLTVDDLRSAVDALVPAIPGSNLPHADPADRGERPDRASQAREGWWARRDSNPRLRPCKGRTLAN